MATEAALAETRTRTRERRCGVVGVVRRGSVHESRDRDPDEERAYLLPA
jgi:hypothetical protein